MIRFSNRGPANIATHVHGQYNRAPFDGWASDFAYPGQYKDYHYPNAQNARTIWYHVSYRRQAPIDCTDVSKDHTEYTTGVNVYLGLEGFYLLTDDEEQALDLPTGDYDIPLSLSAKQYSNNGTLVFDASSDYGIPGDVIQVLA